MATPTPVPSLPPSAYKRALPTGFPLTFWAKEDAEFIVDEIWTQRCYLR